MEQRVDLEAEVKRLRGAMQMLVSEVHTLNMGLCALIASHPNPELFASLLDRTLEARENGLPDSFLDKSIPVDAAKMQLDHLKTRAAQWKDLQRSAPSGPPHR